MLERLVPGSAPTPARVGSAPAPARLASLDILRGFTVLLMVFVDEIGGAFPAINHSPWDNITLADFVMPWFLFMVGTSLSISLRKFRAAPEKGTKFVAARALKLFGLGLLLQGGQPYGWPYQYKYGYNLATARFCGILNRIGFAFFATSLIELWVPARPAKHAGWHAAVFLSQAWRWLAVSGFVVLHLVLTLLTFVPTWTSRYGYNASTSEAVLLPADKWFDIECDLRGSIHSPQCSAAGFFDRLLFGQDHLGVWMSQRLPECSMCAPGSPSVMYRPHCSPTPNATAMVGDAKWCFARMYDPEGALATVPTVGSVWLGTHFGRVLRADGFEGQHAAVLTHWLCCAAVLITAGVALHVGGLPMNKQLWSTSYLFFMAGTCGASLAACYAAVDAAPSGAGHVGVAPADPEGFAATRGIEPPMASGTRGGSAIGVNEGGGPRGSSAGRDDDWRRTIVRAQAGMQWLLFPLQAMGMNAILFFFWHGTAEAVINAVYYDAPVAGPAGYALALPVASTALLGEEGWVHEVLLKGVGIADAASRQLVFVLLKLVCYLAVAVACHRQRYFWKL